MRPRVLVVDDDPGMRAILREFLAREGFEVAEEPSAERALAVLAIEQHPEVVILDNQMPGLKGVDALALVRSRWPELPVMLITAFGGPRVEEQARRLGAACYVEKPFRVSELIVQLKRLTGRRDAPGARATEQDSRTDG